MCSSDLAAHCHDWNFESYVIFKSGLWPVEVNNERRMSQKRLWKVAPIEGRARARNTSEQAKGAVIGEECVDQAIIAASDLRLKAPAACYTPHRLTDEKLLSNVAVHNEF